MIRAALVLMLLVGGCAANEAVRSKPPVISLTSARPPAELQECMTVALAPLAGLQVTREADTRVITVGSKDQTFAVVTIKGEAPSQIEVRQAGVFNKHWRNAIRACAANELH